MQVDAEIARVKTIVSTTGVLPYAELEGTIALPSSDGGNVPKPAAAIAKNDSNPLPTLLAAEAFKGGDINTRTSAIPLGSAEWRIFKLPAGTYDVLMIFATERLPLPERITLNLGDRQFTGTVATERATGSPETFRLLRLCQITLDSDVNSGVLGVTASSSDKPLIWLKKLVFAPPKPPSAPAPK
jgi:hypothetical protein